MDARVRAAGVVLVSMLVAGCASIDPYPPSQEYSTYKKKLASSESGSRGPVYTCPNVSSGMEKAYCQRFEYEQRLRQLGLSNSLNAIGLLGLGAVVAYKGPNVANSQKNVQALTFGGTAWYAGNTYLYKKPREAIYASGILALDCAIEEASPWILAEDPRLGEVLPRLEASVQSLATRVEAAEEAQLAAESELENCDSVSADQHTRLAELQTLLRVLADQLAGEKSDLAHGKRYDFDYRVNKPKADRNLRSAVSAIHNAVVLQIYKMQPDPSALSASLGPFVPTQKAPATTPPKADKASLVAAAAPPGGTCKLDGRLDELEKRIQHADNFRTGSGDKVFDSKALEYVRNTIAQDPGIPATSGHYPQCAALAVAGGGQLQLVQESAAPLVLKKGESLQIGFIGGTPPFKATLVATPNALSRVISPSPNGLGYILHVSSDKTTSTGTYVILLTDADGATRVIEVKVNE